MNVFCQWDACSAIFVILLWLSIECPGYAKPTAQVISEPGLHKTVDDFVVLMVLEL